MNLGGYASIELIVEVKAPSPPRHSLGFAIRARRKGWAFPQCAAAKPHRWENLKC